MITSQKIRRKRHTYTLLNIEADVPVENGEVFQFLFDDKGGLVTGRMFDKFKKKVM